MNEVPMKCIIHSACHLSMQNLPHPVDSSMVVLVDKMPSDSQSQGKAEP